MERSTDIEMIEDHKVLKIWSYYNLGVFNGHTRKYRNRMATQKTLEIDPKYMYASKGIVWIIFRTNEIPPKRQNYHGFCQKNMIRQIFIYKITNCPSNNQPKSANRDLLSYNEKNNYGPVHNKYNVFFFESSISM